MNVNSELQKDIGEEASDEVDDALQLLYKLIVESAPETFERAEHFSEVTWKFASGHRISVSVIKPEGKGPAELLDLHTTGLIKERSE